MISRFLAQILAAGRDDIVRFTVRPTASSRQLRFSVHSDRGFVMHWGDGSTDSYATPGTGDYVIEHTWASAGTYQVSFEGDLQKFSVLSNSILCSIDEIRSESLTELNCSSNTGLASLPQVVDAPNLVTLTNAFKDCRSITSELPALWLSHASAAHSGCFVNCFRSCYSAFASSCTSRNEVNGTTNISQYYAEGPSRCKGARTVAEQKATTKYFALGTDCKGREWVAGTPTQTYWDQNGTRCSYNKTKTEQVKSTAMIEDGGCKNKCRYWRNSASSGTTTVTCPICKQYNYGYLDPYSNNERYCKNSTIPGIDQYAVSYRCGKCGNEFIIKPNRTASFSGQTCTFAVTVQKTTDYCSNTSSGLSRCGSTCKATVPGTGTKGGWTCNWTAYSKVTVCSAACAYKEGSDVAGYTACDWQHLSKVPRCSANCGYIVQKNTGVTYQCARTGSQCANTACPYPAHNESSVNAAKSRGWA